MPKRSSVSPRESSVAMAPTSSKPRTTRATSKQGAASLATAIDVPTRRSKRCAQKLDALQLLGHANPSYRDRREDDNEDDVEWISTHAPKVLRTPSRSRSAPKSRSSSPTSTSSNSSVRWSAPSFKEIERRLNFDAIEKQNEDKFNSGGPAKATNGAGADDESFESMVASLGTLSITPNVKTRRRRSMGDGITSGSRKRVSIGARKAPAKDEMLRIECNDEEAVVDHVVSKRSTSPRRSSRLQTANKGYGNKMKAPITRSRSKSPSAATARSRSRSPSGAATTRSRSKSPSSRATRSRAQSPSARATRSRAQSPSARATRSRAKSPSAAAARQNANLGNIAAPTGDAIVVETVMTCRRSTRLQLKQGIN